MLVTDIQAAVAALNAAEPAAKPKKPAAKPIVAVIKPNGHAVFDPEEQLRIQAGRIVTAFNMTVLTGVTVVAIVQGVRGYEQAYRGAVQ